MEQHLVKTWTCPCGQRYVAEPGESLESLVHYHQLYQHDRPLRGTQREWRVVANTAPVVPSARRLARERTVYLQVVDG